MIRALVGVGLQHLNNGRTAMVRCHRRLRVQTSWSYFREDVCSSAAIFAKLGWEPWPFPKYCLDRSVARLLQSVQKCSPSCAVDNLHKCRLVDPESQCRSCAIYASSTRTHSNSVNQGSMPPLFAQPWCCITSPTSFASDPTRQLRSNDNKCSVKWHRPRTCG